MDDLTDLQSKVKIESKHNRAKEKLKLNEKSWSQNYKNINKC